MNTSEKGNGNYGYHPLRKGHQPTNPGNGYQPSTSGPSSPAPSNPPSGGSGAQSK